MLIDLITGFLGSGKTTFIRLYARELMRRGEKICILENDYGAVNVDMMFLQDLLGEQCELEMVIGGDGYEAHRRRFRTKLISMAMMGYDRVLVEPSGVYDVDEFFDVLREEPLDRWYTIGNVISIVSSQIREDLSEESEYLLASQIANAGCVILSKSDEVSCGNAQGAVEMMNRIMDKFHCKRRFGNDVIAADLLAPDPLDFEAIMRCGYHIEDHLKYQVEKSNGYKSLFYFYVRMTESEVRNAVDKIFIIHRVNHDFLRVGADFFGASEIQKFGGFGNVVEVCKERLFGIVDLMVGMHYEVESRRFKNTLDEDIHYAWEQIPTEQKIEFNEPKPKSPYEPITEEELLTQKEAPF